MVVKKEDLKKEEQLSKIEKKLEQRIDQTLKEGYIPGEKHVVDVWMSWYPTVLREIAKKYQKAGWKIKFKKYLLPSDKTYKIDKIELS